MADSEHVLLIAIYQDDEVARTEFDGLVQRVSAKQIASDGLILVAKSPGGEVSLVNTGSHLGRKGAGWGGGIGVLVGLLAPPMLASVAVGAAAGGLVGKFANHKLSASIQDKIGNAMPTGSAAVIGIFEASSRLAAEEALPGSAAKSVAEMDSAGLRDLKASLAEAMGKFNPDRTVLPIPDRVFGGTVGRTLRDSVADWSFVPGCRPQRMRPTS
jgi:arylsulfatase